MTLLRSTFGRSLAGCTLVKCLEEIEDEGKRKRYVKRCGSTFHDFSVGLKELWKIGDPIVFTPMWVLWKKEFLSRINILNVPITLRTHLATALTALAREVLRQYLSNHPKVGKAKKAELRRCSERHEEDFLRGLADGRS